jgi:hypothetical protein
MPLAACRTRAMHTRHVLCSRYAAVQGALIMAANIKSDHALLLRLMGRI